MTALSDLGPVKLMGLLRRRADFTHDAFRAHWRTTHKVEALKLTPFFTAYNQIHRRAEPLPGFAAPCDGAPELWFAGLEKIAAMQASEAYMTGAYVDEPNFMDGRAQGLLLQDRVVKPGPAVMAGASGARALVFVCRRATVDTDDFDAWLRAFDAPGAELTVPPIRAVHSTVLSVEGAPRTYDAVVSYWWPDLSTLQNAWGRGALNNEASAYIDAERSDGFIADDEHVYWPDDGVDYAG